MEYCDTSKIVIERTKKDVVSNIVLNKHYANTWTASSDIYAIYYKSGEHKFFDGDDLKLIGCVIYGNPVGFRVIKSICEELSDIDVLELKRLWIEDGYGKNIESYCIAQTLKMLKKDSPQTKVVISYADPGVNHKGIIYRASNWLYQGNRIRPNDSWLFKWEEEGKWQHGRTIFPYYKTNDPEEIRKQVNKTFWIRKELQKHRYVYILASKRNKKKILKTLKHETLPYPKSRDTDESDIIKMEPIK